MRIGLLSPSIYMSAVRFKDMIFAPRELAIDLADGLTDKGHDVFLFTSPDTVTKAFLVGGDSQLLKEEVFEEKAVDKEKEKAKIVSFYSAKRNYEVDLTSRCYKMALEGKLDIVHSYHDTMAHFFEDLTGFPAVYTLHDPLPSDKKGLMYWLLNKYRYHRYVSISDSFRKNSSLNLNFIATVYHGLRASNFQFQEKPSDYLLFMGRLTQEKGLHHAIKAAIKLNLQLEIGTQFPDKHHESIYFQKEIKPYLDNPFIGEPGMVKGEEKILLYKQARVLLFPILWEEPFGLVMIEAMACGTPVIAYGRGSVPEVVVDGVTGFIVEPENSKRVRERVRERVRPLSISRSDPEWIIKKTGIEGLVEAVKRMNAMSEEEYGMMRLNCRRHVEKKFTVEKMVDGYEAVYQKVLHDKQMTR